MKTDQDATARSSQLYTSVQFLIISKEISWHGKLINSAQQILIRSLGNPSLLFKSSLPDHLIL